MDKKYDYINLLEKHASALNLVSHILHASPFTPEKFVQSITETRELCPKIKNVNDTEETEKINAYQNILHDCFISANMINVLLHSSSPLAFKVEENNLNQLLVGYKEHGYMVAGIQCLLSHDSHFMTIINIRGVDYLLQSYFGKYKLIVKVIDDVDDFLSKLFQIGHDVKMSTNSSEYLLYIWKELIQTPAEPLIQDRKCEPILDFYIYKKNWQSFSSILKNCEFCKELFNVFCRGSCLEEYRKEIEEKINELISYLEV
jgi:hypothetical protein